MTYQVEFGLSFSKYTKLSIPIAIGFILLGYFIPWPHGHFPVNLPTLGGILILCIVFFPMRDKTSNKERLDNRA